MKLFTKAIIASFIFLTSAFPIKASEKVDVFDATLVVGTDKGVGAGTVISPKGKILTAAHLVPEGYKEVKIVSFYGLKTRGIVIKIDRQIDLAIIQEQPIIATSWSRISQSHVFSGANVFAVGHPLRTYWTITYGRVSNFEDYNTIVDITVNPGNSGGGLYNQKGELVGVCSAMMTSGLFIPIPSHLAVFVSLDTINDFLRPYKLGG